MRTWLAATLAIVVTLALFYLMLHLIAGDPVSQAAPVPPKVVDHVPAPDPVEPKPIDDDPPPIDKPKHDFDPEVVVKVEPPTDPVVPTIRPPGPAAVKTRLTTPGDGDRSPMPKFAPPPQYPRGALVDRTEGWVRVSFTIGADGSVSDASVVGASPRRGVFDDAALAALRRWRFEPKRDADGNPVASRAEYTIEFKIDDGA